MTTLAVIKTGTITTNGSTTGTQTGWGTSTLCFLGLASAYNSSSPTGHTVSGGGVNWSRFSSAIEPYRIRRGLDLFVADAVPDGTAITITAIGGTTTFAETKYKLFELAEYDAANVPKDAFFQTNVSTGLTSLDSGSIGTIAGDDLAIALGACEGAAVSFAPSAGSTTEDSDTGGSDVRSFVLSSSTSDNTPGFTWSDSGVGAAIYAFIAQDGATGTHSGGSSALPLLNSYYYG